MSVLHERDLILQLVETPREDHLVVVDGGGYDMTRDEADFSYTVISGPLAGTGYEIVIRQRKERT